MYGTQYVGSYFRYKGLKGSDAEQFLISKKGGEVQGAYRYKGDDVDLIWGGYNKNKKQGLGLAKIIEKHPEVLGSIQKLLNTLPEIYRNKKRIVLSSDKSVVVISLIRNNKSKSRIMTAYNK